LVTGSGGGLGRSIVRAALAAGDRVLATARDVSRLQDLVAPFGDRIRTAPLDVTDEAQGQEAVKAAGNAFGRLDVVVNNAGYGDSRPFEEMPAEEFRRLVETVFYGVVNLTRAALPVMRAQRSGLIIQISSAGGRFAAPGNAAYFAAKWAVGGFTDAVRTETAPFNVRMITLEPGGMRTAWGKQAYGERKPIGADYEASVGRYQRQLDAYWGNEPIDPNKFAALIARLPDMGELPARLLIGADTIASIKLVEAQRVAAQARWQRVAEAVDFGSRASIIEVQPLPETASQA
jgi:NAD(P)-dependent dehydrogenase (short-subunit alcohol dehydrogenase family)